MGNDPSKGGQKAPGGAGKREVKVDPTGAQEGEVPYTSYSVDRSKNSQVKDIRSQNATDIITVVEVNSGTRSNLEPELQSLDRIATFEPLVKQTGWPFGASNKPGPEMDPQALLKLCGEYQSFCRKIASVVSQQQTVLCARMRAKEGHALEASRALQKHLQDVRQFELMFRDVEKIHLQINTTRQLLTQVIAKTEEVCSQLPQKYQLSPIRSFIEDRSQLPIVKGEEDESARHAQQSEGDEQDEYEEEKEKEEERETSTATVQDGGEANASTGGAEGSVAAQEENAESDNSPQLATEPKGVVATTEEEEPKEEAKEVVDEASHVAVPGEAEAELTAPDTEEGPAEDNTTAETAQDLPPEGAPQ